MSQAWIALLVLLGVHVAEAVTRRGAIHTLAVPFAGQRSANARVQLDGGAFHVPVPEAEALQMANRQALDSE
ncbi:hypothetical protein AK812_SmicGene22576 [Symbiodinium microadriaticum]|uniref:Uncharacterized protein n=1 Tax=Symbiodinium microadriaticum TaxID=2951 RepID=A0A1Q9CN14_SYMMI|nr:hypothetical protein AK812_SmicGene34845 [Symbiodinium microadriaticum]OLP95316.1 hypothetical protein AK812_SmicGene22576 [Symbiodinium microadriaticum]